MTRKKQSATQREDWTTIYSRDKSIPKGTPVACQATRMPSDEILRLLPSVERLYSGMPARTAVKKTRRARRPGKRRGPS